MGSSVLHGGGAPLEAQDHVGRVAEEALRPLRRRRGAVLRGDEGVELLEGDVDREETAETPKPETAADDSDDDLTLTEDEDQGKASWGFGGGKLSDSSSSNCTV